MKDYPIRWMRLARMLGLWIVFYLFITFGLFWFPQEKITIGNYTLTKDMLVHALVVLLIAKSFNIILRTFLWDYFIARMLKGLTPYLLIQISSLIIYFIAVLIIIGAVFGESVIGFLTTFGAIGVIIGFGVQRLVLDAFSGVSINIDSPFSLGDYILVRNGNKDYAGLVIGISWRLTTIQTDEGSHVTLPNAVVTGNPVINFSRPKTTSEFEQLYFFPLCYDEKRVKEVLYKAVYSVISMGYIQDKPKKPNVKFSVLEPGRMGFKIKYWVDPLIKGGPGKAKNFLNSAVMSHVKYSELEFHDPTIRTMKNHQGVEVTKELKRFQYLKNISFFSCLSDDEMNLLARNFIEKEFKQSDFLVQENTADNCSMYLIYEGYADVYVENKKQKNDVLKVATLNPGDFFGEMSLLTGEKRKATIKAGSDLRVYEITKEGIASLLEKNEQLYKSFAQLIAERLLDNQELLKEIDKKSKNNKTIVDVCLEKIKNFFLK